MAFDLPQGVTTGRHSHPYGQLVHAASGVMRVLTDRGSWIVPPNRAVWIPSGLEHEVQAVTSVAMRTIYVVDAAVPRAPKESCVVSVSPLLRELILEGLRLPRPYPRGGAEERLFGVMVEQMTFGHVIPLHLPMPSSRSLLEIAGALERDPSDARTVAAWGRASSRSARTLAREFLRETGLSFGAWRAQLRLMKALELLARRRSVTEVALSLGYESTSAFIRKFREHLGTTPARYFAAAPPAPTPVVPTRIVRRRGSRPRAVPRRPGRP